MTRLLLVWMMAGWGMVAAAVPEKSLADSAALGRAVERGEAQAARPVAEQVFAARNQPEMVRACAARVLLAADPSRLAAVLSDPSQKVRQAAFGRGLDIPASGFAAALKGASPELKRAILARLVQMKAKDCVGAVVALVADADEATAVAATAALGTLGGPDQAALLETQLARGGAVAKAAEGALAEMPGIGAFVFDRAETNPAFLGIAAKRAEAKLVARWEPFIKSADPNMRKTAWRAFGRMISEATFPQACAWYLDVKAEEAEAAANALWRVVKDRADGTAPGAAQAGGGTDRRAKIRACAEKFGKGVK